jgi:ABC-type phosphate transport system substrate-binding protein
MLKRLALAAGLLLSAQAAMAQLVVVVNPGNNNALDAKTVQRIFLGKDKKFADGNETIAVNQVADAEIRQTFDEELLGRSSSQVSAYWSKLVFTGKGIPPKEVANDAEVIALVAQNPSVIGYIDKASATDAVKVIEL